MDEVRWKTNRFKEFGLFAQEAASVAMRTVMAAALNEAMQNIQRNGSVDTGAMRASMYMEVGGTPGRGAALAAAVALNAGARGALIEWVPEKPLEGKVACGVHYGIYVEMGTERSQAKEFLGPAILTVKAMQEDIYRRVVREYLAKV